MSEQQPQGADAALELNNELKARREKLSALREHGVAFPNDFRRDGISEQLHAQYDEKSNEELEALNIEVSVAGRMMTRRIMGKASAAASSFTWRATTWRKAFTTNSLKSGTWATFSARAANCSKPKPANSLSIAPNCAC